LFVVFTIALKESFKIGLLVINRFVLLLLLLFSVVFIELFELKSELIDERDDIEPGDFGDDVPSNLLVMLLWCSFCRLMLSFSLILSSLSEFILKKKDCYFFYHFTKPLNQNIKITKICKGTVK
jgi:hypothetical protein